MRALACAAVGALVIAGCGGGDGKSSGGLSGTPDPKAKAAAQAYLDAYAKRSPKGICAALTPKVQQQLADNKGTCVKTVKFSLKGQRFGPLEVSDARSTGDNATAAIANSQREILLQRVDGAWKVSDGGT